MMSRITLSLRKQACAREVDPVLCSLKVSCATPRFVHRSYGMNHTTSDLRNASIMVQAHSVVHDDQGEVISVFDVDDLDSIAEAERRKDSGWGGCTKGNEWYELRPPAPIVQHCKPTQGTNDTVVMRMA